MWCCTNVVGLHGFQVQVDEYKQLKETLNKMPSLRHAAGQLQQHEAAKPIQNGNAEENNQPHDAQPEVLKLFTYHAFKTEVFPHSCHWFKWSRMRSVSCGSPSERET